MSRRLKAPLSLPLKQSEEEEEEEVNPEMIVMGINLESFYPPSTKVSDDENEPAPANQAQVNWLSAWSAHDLRKAKPTNEHVNGVFPPNTFGLTENNIRYNREGLRFQQILYIERPDEEKGRIIFDELSAHSKKRKADMLITHINGRKRKNLNKDGSHGQELKPPAAAAPLTQPAVDEAASITVTNLLYSNGQYSGQLGLHTRDRRGAEGVFRWTSGAWKGCEYRGPYVDDLKHGEAGRMTFKNGDVFEGQFKDDVMEGYGVCKYASGDVYTGNWRKNEKFGPGKMVWKNGDTYEGSWCPLFKYEKGTFTFANGDKYEGEYMLGMYHGLGKLTRKNGIVVHDGQWCDGEKVVEKV